MPDSEQKFLAMMARINERLTTLYAVRDTLKSMIDLDPELNTRLGEAIDALSKPINYLERRQLEGERAIEEVTLSGKPKRKDNPDA